MGWLTMNEFHVSLLLGFNTFTITQEVVTNSMRTKLAQAYTVGEVEKAIKDMAPLKALGLDGMPPYSITHIGRI